ncbi:MAG: hypothetical protein K0U59_05855, partial [Gammaproteobacteria bacterium]|nr:hypothetical protein [Gammaproteobacteria bacterium]
MVFFAFNISLLSGIRPFNRFLMSFSNHLARLTLLATLGCSAMAAELLSPTVLSLPGGPGSIEGLGESFSPQLNTGTGQYQVDLITPPGRNGLAPKLQLQYNSGLGNGLIGVGIKLPIPYVQRQTDLGLPNYSEWPAGDQQDNNKNGQIDEFEEADQFIDDQGQELVQTKAGHYRAKIESEFIQYERLEKGWLLHYPNGDKLQLGTIEATTIVSDTRVFRWYPEKYTDANGNVLAYHWQKIDQSTQPYLTEISYNHGPAEPARVQFNYEERPDILIEYRAGYEIKTQYRLSTVTMYAQHKTIRQYKLDYYPHTALQPLSQLKRITEYGADLTTHLPPVNFSWTQFDPRNADRHIMPGVDAPLYAESTEFFDMDGDGLPDLLNTGLKNHIYWKNKGPNAQGVVQWSKREQMRGRSNLKLSNDNNLLADFDADGRTEILNYTREDTRVFAINDSFEWESQGSLQRVGVQLDSENTRLIDINHDKRIDALSVVKTGRSLHFRVWLNLPQGWSKAIDLPTHRDLHALDFGSPRVHLADMNGDRLPDIVKILQVEKDLQVIYFPHQGLSGFGERVEFTAVTNVPLSPEKIRFADVNGDGRADLVKLNGLNLNGTRAELWLNQGLDLGDHSVSHFSERIDIYAPDTINSPAAVRLLDINGNGSQDVVWYQRTSGDGGYAATELSPHEQPYQLKSIDNGLGKKTTLEYVSLQRERLRDIADGKPWEKTMPIGMQVIKSITVQDRLTGTTQRSSFNYHNGWYNPTDKTFWGFEGVEAIEHGSPNTPSLHRVNTYHLGEDAEALKGKIKVARRQNAQDALFDQESYTWEPVPVATPIDEDVRGIHQPQLTSLERTLTELNQGEAVVLHTQFAYDNFGNTVRIEEQGRQGGNWQDERITHWRYSAETTDGQGLWMLQRPIERTVTDLDQQLVAKEQWFYDDESFGGNNLGTLTQGNLTLHRAWHDPTDPNAYIERNRYRYDSVGNIIARMDPLWGEQPGHLIETTFDPMYTLFPIEERIHTGSRVLTAKASYDVGTGVMKSATDFNGQQTQYQHDALGRLTAIVQPGDSLSAPTLTYDYQLAQPVGDGFINWIETRQRESAGGGTINSRHYYDGLGRTLMVKSEAEQSGQVVVSEHNRYNARGQVETSYLPYFAEGLGYKINQSGPHYRETHYDALGRTKTVYQPPVNGEAASFQRITYQPLVQLLEDEEQTRSGSIHAGAAKRLTFDGLQNAEGEPRLRQLDEIVTAGTDSNSATTRSTRYDYDLNNYFIRLQDAQNNVRNTHYDALGRLRFLSDPNRGQQWQYFDDAGNLLASRDALGQERHYRYDGANRISAEYYLAPRSPAPSNGHWQPDLKLGSAKAVVNYQYDQLETSKETKAVKANAGFLLGRLAKVTDQTGFEQRSYDARGQLIQRDRKITGPGINSPVYSSRFSYDSAGRPTKQTYPNGTWVDFHYNARGLLERIPGVVEQLDYNPNGALTHR